MQKRISNKKHDTSVIGKKCNRLKNRNTHGLSKAFLTFSPKRRWTVILNHLPVHGSLWSFWFDIDSLTRLSLLPSLVP